MNLTMLFGCVVYLLAVGFPVLTYIENQTFSMFGYTATGWLALLLIVIWAGLGLVVIVSWFMPVQDAENEKEDEKRG